MYFRVLYKNFVVETGAIYNICWLLDCNF